MCPLKIAATAKIPHVSLWESRLISLEIQEMVQNVSTLSKTLVKQCSRFTAKSPKVISPDTHSHAAPNPQSHVARIFITCKNSKMANYEKAPKEPIDYQPFWFIYLRFRTFYSEISL